MTETVVVPDFHEEIVAFRAWTLDHEPESRRPLLESLTAADRWVPGGWMEALCDKRCLPEQVPGESCSCGIYAARDVRHLYRMGYGHENDVIGEVGLAGKVIPGSQGWRAAKARPLRLWVSFENWELAGMLRAQYHVPVLVTNIVSPDWDRLLAEVKHGHR